MLQTSQYSIFKALASCVMEQSLVEVSRGSIILNIVSDKIFEKYQCYIPDCFEHPEYLNTVLYDISETIRHETVEYIENQLAEFSYNPAIQEFLERLNPGMDMNLNTSIVA